jgi:transcriptional regulator GlxA family with amidase domain
MGHRISTLRVVVLAHEEMNLLDLTGPVQALFTASQRGSGSGPPLYEIIVASESGGLITTNSGLPVMTAALSTLDGLSIDTVIAPGGCKGDEYYTPPGLVDWVKQRAPTVRRLCSVCTGAFLLAAAGQLDGRRAATHWDWTDRLKKRFPTVEVDPDKIYIRDGSIWTSAGVTAGIDLALALIDQDYGHKTAIETARQLVVFMRRSGGQSQFSVPLAAQATQGDRFIDLHAWVASNLESDLRVERLAEQAGMSTRNFARVYLAKSGRTPAKMVEAMRLEAACRLLEETALPMKRIAAMTGHVDEQNLRRLFMRQLNTTPREYRSRFSAGDVAPRHAPARRLSNR